MIFLLLGRKNVCFVLFFNFKLDLDLYKTLNIFWSPYILHQFDWRGRCGHDCMVVELPVQSVPITTKVVSLNFVHGEVYSIQHYVIKFVSDLQQVGGFFRVLRFPPPIKLTATITEILLKVALNTINHKTINLIGICVYIKEFIFTSHYRKHCI